MKSKEEILTEHANADGLRLNDSDWGDWLLKAMDIYAAQEVERAIAEHEARQMKPQHETFRCRALRKRGTDDWYSWFIDANSKPRYSTDVVPDLWSMQIDPEIIMDGSQPEDAQLVELECRVVKVVE